MINIYLANLGKYNEGELVGKWVGLPCEDLEKELRSIGVSDEPDKNGIYYEEYFIADYETDIHGLKIGEYENLDKLNELAEQVENLSEVEKIALCAFLENGRDFEEALDEIEKQNYYIYWDCDSMEDVAYEIIESMDILRDVPDNIARYFDYEAYGRDLSIEGTFIAIDGHYVEIF